MHERAAIFPSYATAIRHARRISRFLHYGEKERTKGTIMILFCITAFCVSVRFSLFFFLSRRLRPSEGDTDTDDTHAFLSEAICMVLRGCFFFPLVSLSFSLLAVCLC